MSMQRSCDTCGRPFEAKRRTARFCSTNCRVRGNRQNVPRQQAEAVRHVTTAAPAASSGPAEPSATPRRGRPRRQPTEHDEDTAPAPVVALPQPAESPLIAALRRQLDDADRLDTLAGQQALVLARRMESVADSGSAIASVSRELREVIRVAMEGVAVAADPLDELRARRDRRRSG